MVVIRGCSKKVVLYLFVLGPGKVMQGNAKEGMGQWEGPRGWSVLELFNGE